MSSKHPSLENIPTDIMGKGINPGIGINPITLYEQYTVVWPGNTTESEAKHFHIVFTLYKEAKLMSSTAIHSLYFSTKNSLFLTYRWYGSDESDNHNEHSHWNSSQKAFIAH